MTECHTVLTLNLILKATLGESRNLPVKKIKDSFHIFRKARQFCTGFFFKFNISEAY